MAVNLHRDFGTIVIDGVEHIIRSWSMDSTAESEEDPASFPAVRHRVVGRTQHTEIKCEDVATGRMRTVRVRLSLGPKREGIPFDAG